MSLITIFICIDQACHLKKKLKLTKQIKLYALLKGHTKNKTENDLNICPFSPQLFNIILEI